MKEPKELTVSISDKRFNIDLPVQDEGLIDTIFDALLEQTKKGFPFKIKLTYMTSLSDSTQIITKLISNTRQMTEWKEEIKQLISVLRKRE